MGEWDGSGPPSHVVSLVSHQGWWIWTGPATVSHPVPLGTKGMCLWESWMFSGVRSVTKEQTKEEKRSAWSQLPRLWLVCVMILPTKLTALQACSFRKEGSLGTSASWQFPERLIAAAETPWKRVLREIRTVADCRPEQQVRFLYSIALKLRIKSFLTILFWSSFCFSNFLRVLQEHRKRPKPLFKYILPQICP